MNKVLLPSWDVAPLNANLLGTSKSWAKADSVYPNDVPVASQSGYVTANPPLCEYTCAHTFWCNDLISSHNVSVAKLLFRCFKLYILPALYCQQIGSIADLILFCVVTLSVSCAFFVSMHHSSATVSAPNVLCLSVEVNVLFAGIISSVVSLSIFYIDLIDLSFIVINDGSILCGMALSDPEPWW